MLAKDSGKYVLHTMSFSGCFLIPKRFAYKPKFIFTVIIVCFLCIRHDVNGKHRFKGPKKPIVYCIFHLSQYSRLGQQRLYQEIKSLNCLVCVGTVTSSDRHG